jgi:Ca2+-binding RTX toxin-like protein
MTIWNGLGYFNTEVFGQRFDANGNPQPQIVPISVIDPDQNLRGTASHDVIDGGSGNDTIKGLKGNDRLNGHDGDDLIIAGRGWDRITGGEGADTIECRQGCDQIDGNAGNDHLHGSEGNDTMTGGADNDRLSGGRGADSDTFIFEKGNRVDTVKDFNIAEDQIAVSSAFFGANVDIEISFLNALDFSQSQGWLEIRFGADRLRLHIEDADDFYDPSDQGLNWGSNFWCTLIELYSSCR